MNDNKSYKKKISQREYGLFFMRNGLDGDKTQGGLIDLYLIFGDCLIIVLSEIGE
jgi:hypothetical protein